MILTKKTTLAFLGLVLTSAPVSAGFWKKTPSTTATLAVQGGDGAVKKKAVTSSKVKKSFDVEEIEFYNVQKRDSPQQLSDDISYVLNTLRPHKDDPTVSRIFHSKLRPTFAVTWTHEMWEKHVSRWRFVNHFLFWHQSALVKRVMPQFVGLMLWTYVALRICQSDSTPLSKVEFPMTSLSLVSGFVASLLALRSNQGLSRLMEARLMFGKVVLYSRDMASLMRHFVYGGRPELALKMARHVALYPWLLKNFLRGRKVSGDDQDLVRSMLPPADAEYILSQRKMPIAVVMRLRQCLAHLSHEKALSTAEEMAIDHTIQSMDQVVMLTEKLVASPIPPLFTTHAARLLIFYLFFLPIALNSVGSLNSVGIFVTVAAVGYAMLGLDEISHLMEQPFRLTPMYHLCKNAMRDVADAFCLPIPSLSDEKNRKYKAEGSKPYWGPSVGLESQ